MAEALPISLVAIATVFAVLVLLMLVMNLFAFVFRHIGQEDASDASAPKANVQISKAHLRVQKREDMQDEEVVSAILAALQAANISVPAGGRIRIEKVSRNS